MSLPLRSLQVVVAILAAVAVALGLALVGIGGTGASGAPVERSATGTAPLKVVTFNTSVDLPYKTAMEDLAKVFARNPDIVSLQEFWSTRRQESVQALYTDCDGCKYDIYLPIGNGRGSVPILYRSDRFELVGARSVPVTAETYVGPKGAGPATMAGKFANHVLLRHLRTNRYINVINSHFVPSVQGANGGPNKKMPQRLALYRQHMNGIRGMIDEISLGMVFVTGDFNVNYRRDRVTRGAMFPFRNLTRAGLRASYGQLREPRTGTHRLKDGNDTRLIDQIWNSGGQHVIRARWQRIQLGLASDHRPLIVGYQLTGRPVPTPTPTPTPTDPPTEEPSTPVEPTQPNG